ncbi:hypothetical protein LTR37_012549 [Vermiconidia calcicola]|uniref:Uncharacterized protein n=1 Tax=Vermiconidia calcicola TaxID=1690605 RepID=A0ACC3MYX4_9PEZI|nr:hypothetical protein LTR37_012549 [Vermiconidia calcicola]
MAEAAAAAAVYEVVETSAQIGVGAYMVAKPTMPLKATFSQIATSSDDDTKLSLSRSGHTLCIVKNKAYLFGGETAADKLSSNEVHAVTLEPSEKGEPDYSVVPAVPDVEGGKVPVARRGHAACAFNICVAIFGGIDEGGEVIDEGSMIWLFNAGKSAWETLESSNPDTGPQPRRDAHLYDHQNNLVLYGGYSVAGESLKDVWHFDYVSRNWTQLPDAPISTSNATLSDGNLYIISGEGGVSGDLHFLPLTAKAAGERSWHTVPFPTNPLVPGPLARTGAGLLPVSTGYGRQYLLYLFGARSATSPEGNASTDDQSEHETKDSQPQFWSDMWTYQLPSSQPQLKATTNIYEALKPAKIKDAIRGALGVDDGKHSWGEVEVLPPTDMESSGGKVHPGPRASFACDVMKDKRTVVIWGGVNPKGDREGDGWMIKLE